MKLFEGNKSNILHRNPSFPPKSSCIQLQSFIHKIDVTKLAITRHSSFKPGISLRF